MFALIFAFVFVSTFYNPVICVNRKIILKKTHNYGPYHITTRSVDTCKPSKPFDEKNKAVNVSLKVIKISRTEEDFRGSYTFPNDVKIIKALLLSESHQSGGVVLIDFRKQIDKPCENLFFAYILINLMKADSNCVVKKGIHRVQNIQANMLAHRLFKNLHYNTHFVTLEFYGAKGTIACIKVTCEMKPPK